MCFDKIQLPFIIKFLCQLGRGEILQHLVKTTANLTLIGKTLDLPNTFSSWEYRDSH